MCFLLPYCYLTVIYIKQREDGISQLKAANIRVYEEDTETEPIRRIVGRRPIVLETGSDSKAKKKIQCRRRVGDHATDPGLITAHRKASHLSMNARLQASSEHVLILPGYRAVGTLDRGKREICIRSGWNEDDISTSDGNLVPDLSESQCAHRHENYCQHDGPRSNVQ